MTQHLSLTNHHHWCWQKFYKTTSATASSSVANCLLSRYLLIDIELRYFDGFNWIRVFTKVIQNKSKHWFRNGSVIITNPAKLGLLDHGWIWFDGSVITLWVQSNHGWRSCREERAWHIQAISNFKLPQKMREFLAGKLYEELELKRRKADILMEIMETPFRHILRVNGTVKSQRSIFRWINY